MKTSVVRIYRMPLIDNNSHFVQTRLHLMHILDMSQTFFECPVLDIAGLKGEHAIFYSIVKGDSIIDKSKKSKTSRI